MSLNDTSLRPLPWAVADDHRAQLALVLQRMAQGLADAASEQVARHPQSQEAHSMLRQSRMLADRAQALATRLFDESAAEAEIGRLLDESLAQGLLDGDETLFNCSRFAAAPDGWSADFGIRSTLPH